ncbi:MAG: hypothetical protein JWM21_2274 [Acidobacteria bacterium]|nr:hypothetical protein [Acidobacteriota bacterium]
MSPQTQEPSLIGELSRLLTVSASLLAEQRVTAPNIRRFTLRAEDCLRKIYGADSELIKEFNSVSDARLGSDPKIGLQRITLFVQRIVNSLENDVIARAREFEKAGGTGEFRRMFVGHGRSPRWSRVVNHLKGDLGMADVQAFESSSRTSEHIVDILNGFLDTCDAAVIVMTADDRTAEGSGRARQNVIHEIGLFQGRQGFSRVILLQ